MTDVPAVPNFTPGRRSPRRLAITVPGVSVPQQIVLRCDGVNHASIGGKKMDKLSPALAHLLRCGRRPCRLPILVPGMIRPEQIPIGVHGVDDPIASAEHLREIPACADFTSTSVSPPVLSREAAGMAIPLQVAIGIDGVNCAIESGEYM